MAYKYGKEVLQGLVILQQGIETEVLPDEFVTAICPAVVRLVGEAGLASLTMVPPDDLDPEVRERRDQMRTVLSALFGPRD